MDSDWTTGVRFPANVGIILFDTAPTQSLIFWVPGVLPTEVKSRFEVHREPSSNAEVKNTRNFAYTSAYIFMER
jgi:hypothetical protein